MSDANDDAYHDGRREISRVARACVEKIVEDWMKNYSAGKTFSVRDLLWSDYQEKGATISLGPII